MAESSRSISPASDLPSEDVRESLLDAVTTLLRRMGFEPLVSGPLVVGTAAFFPEPVPRTVGGLRGLLRRLLVFAGLTELQPELYTFEAGDELSAELAAGAARHTQVPAFFAGIEEPTEETPAPRALFGFDVTRWGDPELLLGTMAHEVAHAYRRHHKLEARDREIEERLTDLTAVMLGFGPLVLNAAYIHKSSVEQSGGWVSQEVTLTRTGYLPPEELGFLLAIVLRVRDLTKVRRLALLDELASAQRRMVEASLRALPSRAELLRRLELPDPATWPSETPASPEELAFVLDQADDDEPLIPEAERPDARLGRPAGVTYRLATSRASATFSGAMLGTFLGLVPMAVGAPTWTVLVTMGLGVAGMLALPLYTCADPACGAWIVGQAATCRGCGRPVRGTLGSPDEWHELEDRDLQAEGDEGEEDLDEEDEDVDEEEDVDEDEEGEDDGADVDDREAEPPPRPAARRASRSNRRR